MLKKYRKKIDNIDSKIISLLSERLNLSEKIGKYKIKNNINIYDKEREQDLFKKLENLSKEYKLDEKYINKVFKTIIKESRKKQNG